jgi:hypothetical protein
MHMTRRTRRLHGGFLWLFAAAALTACGGGGTTTASRDFQVEANRVCRNAEAQLNRIQSTHPQTADQAEKQAAALVDVSQQALDDLHQIEPPAALKAGYERYLSSREQALGFIEDARDAASDNDALGYDRAKRRLSVQQPLRRQLALRIGLRDCSRPVPSS